MNKKDIEAIYALSPLQQGLLFHSLYAPDTGAYVEQMSCTLSGPLDLPLLEQAWAQVIRRHTILRTGFVWERLEKPMQVVQKQAAMAAHAKPGQIHALRVDLVRGYDIVQQRDERVGIPPFGLRALGRNHDKILREQPGGGT